MDPHLGSLKTPTSISAVGRWFLFSPTVNGRRVTIHEIVQLIKMADARIIILAASERHSRHCSDILEVLLS